MTEKNVLILAHQTAQSEELAEAVHARAAAGPVRFTLVVPSIAPGLHKVVDPTEHGDRAAHAAMEAALPVLEEAAGAPVEGQIGDSNPLDAAQDAVNLGDFDEIIVSTLPHRVSAWLRLDLPHKLEGLGLPVTAVTAESADREYPSVEV
ncbi:MAG TPA: hypothetical protein VNT22_00185 [Baekduia sp.]|nr:hypothetical protein [Baekduia sp.]